MAQSCENELNETENFADKPQNEVRRFRVVFAQVLAVCSINFILLDLGMILALPTIIIPDLLKPSNNWNISIEQTSWLGSLAFISQPLGSALSGLMFESVGRKTTMLYVNIPIFFGWLLMYLGKKINHFYIAQILMGTSIGLMDAPHISYLGEITQPNCRAILISFAELCVAFGFCFVYLLNLITNWRMVSIICSLVPILSILLISRIPESFVWLLSKGKEEDSLKSLCWLRGWVNPDVVNDEFNDLKKHFPQTALNFENEENQFFKYICKRTNERNFMRKFINFSGLRNILRKSVLRPLFLVAIYFGFSHIAGVTNTRPFMVEILKELGTPVSAFTVTAISSTVSICGLITGMVLVPKTGKRFLSIASMFGCFLINGLISLYGLLKIDVDAKWIPACLFLMLNFCWNCGVGQIPWMLISEMFPFHGRGFASGIVAAISYVEAFVFIKTYYSLYNMLSISGAFLCFSLCSLLGSLFLYVFLPETEGKTLEQITVFLENHFTNLFKLNKP